MFRFVSLFIYVFCFVFFVLFSLLVSLLIFVRFFLDFFCLLVSLFLCCFFCLFVGGFFFVCSLLLFAYYKELLPAGCLFVGCCWLLNVPATGECISGTDLLRQFYVLPH